MNGPKGATPLRAVLFDIDGTLVDSNDAHARAWLEVLARHGYEATYDEVRRLIGKGGDKLLPEVTGLDKDSPPGKRITSERKQLFLDKYLPLLRPFPGTEALLRRVDGTGRKVVAASSAGEDELQALLKLTGAPELFDTLTSSSDAEQSKPDPDIVQAALQRSGCRADEVYMVGDTPYDVEAAGAAGVRVIGVRCGGWGDADLRGAAAIYDGPADLLAHFEDSPLR